MSSAKIRPWPLSQVSRTGLPGASVVLLAVHTVSGLGNLVWSSSDAQTKLPSPDTVWTASSTTLAPGKPVRLTWDNGQGLIFALDISLDDYFMFDVKQSVENKSDKP